MNSEEKESKVAKKQKQAAIAAEQAQKDKRTNKMYAAIAVVFVLVGIAGAIFNTGYFQRTATAATINGVDYTAAEVNYHYQNSYQSFVSQYGDYIAYTGLDTSSSLKSQAYSDEMTWHDYFLEQALDQLAAVAAMVETAQAEGYVFPDSVQAEAEETIASIELYAPYYGYTDADAYLIGMYGSTMTMEVYEACLLASLQADNYATAYQDSLVYEEADLVAAYQANPENYDTVDYEYLYVYNPVSSTDADGNAIDVTDDMEADALAEAKALADELYADFIAGTSLSDAADSNDMASYGSANSSAYSAGDTLSEWLFDSSRQAGDSALLEDTTYGVYYVVTFYDRYLEEYNVVDVRHILTMPATGVLTSTDEGYEEELASLDASALSSAEYIYDEYLAGDQTEDAFAELANIYSEDTGSNTNGGLYENVAKGEMMEAFENWCFDASRQIGDTDIVATDYGYHVMYFCGEGLPYWQYVATTTLQETEFETWYNAIMDNYAATSVSSGLSFVG